MNQRNIPNEPSPRHVRQLQMTNAVVHLWLAIENLDSAEEANASADVRAIMEGLAQKHNLPVIDAEAFANSVGDI